MAAAMAHAFGASGPRTRPFGSRGRRTKTRATSLELVNPEDGQEVRGERRPPVLLALPGGDVEQLLAFPLIEAIKRKNPGCCVDVLLPSRGKSAYGINPNVRFTFVEELDGDPRPDEINAVVGKLRNKGYGKLISAKPAGANFSLQMAATTIPEKVSYISTEGYIFNWIANLVMKGERVPTMKMASLGASMYDLLWKLALDEDAPSEKRLDFRIPTNARESAKEKLEAQSLVPGKFALLQALPVPDTGAEPEACDWSKVGSNAKVPVVYVAKSKKEAKTYAGTNALVAPTVAELAALVDISVGVVCGNTPALQLGAALKKPLVLVSKDDKVAGTFVPGATVKTVSSPEAADSIIATW